MKNQIRREQTEKNHKQNPLEAIMIDTNGKNKEDHEEVYMVLASHDAAKCTGLEGVVKSLVPADVKLIIQKQYCGDFATLRTDPTKKDQYKKFRAGIIELVKKNKGACIVLESNYGKGGSPKVSTGLIDDILESIPQSQVAVISYTEDSLNAAKAKYPNITKIRAPPSKSQMIAWVPSCINHIYDLTSEPEKEQNTEKETSK